MGTPSAAAAASAPTRWRAGATHGPPWRAAWPRSTQRSPRAGRRPPAAIPSRRVELHSLSHSPLRPGAARAHPRRRDRRRGRGAAPLPAEGGRAVRRGEAGLDRADAPADAANPPGAAARAPRARRGRRLPGRAPDVGRAGGAGPAPRARSPPRRRAARGAAAGRFAARRARALVPPPGPGRGGATPRRRLRPRRHELRGAPDPRPAHALGLVLLQRRDELQLAAAPRPRRDPRLRRGARGGAPRAARPLAPLLAPACLALPGLARARGVAAPPRPRAATPSERNARLGR